jgi:hypothetical protein
MSRPGCTVQLERIGAVVQAVAQAAEQYGAMEADVHGRATGISPLARTDLCTVANTFTTSLQRSAALETGQATQALFATCDKLRAALQLAGHKVEDTTQPSAKRDGGAKKNRPKGKPRAGQ